jgi:aconitate decarboxylase
MNVHTETRVRGITERLADHVVATRFEALPSDVINVTKMIVLDGVANMLAGSRQPLASILVDFVQSMGGVGTATLIGRQERANPPYAAFCNAAFCHVLDYEAMWWPPTHPTSPVLPSLLALCEHEGYSGKKLIEAFVAGLEVQGRLNIMLDWFKDPYNYFHPPGTIGVLGSAAACARLFDLDAWKTRMAIGIACSRASGLWVNSGTMTKSQHSANSARSGVEAALLARAGYDADANAIEAKNGGFAKLFYGDEADVEMAVKDFGNPYRIVVPGVTIKKHPAQTTTHWCIDAALDIKHEHKFDGSEVDHVVVHVGKPNWSSQWLRPRTGLDGKFSIHYTVALALMDGEIKIDSFTDERRFAPDMEDMLGRIEVIETEDIPHGMLWPETWATVEVHLKDGRILREKCEKPRGRGDKPLTREEHLVKVYDCASHVLTPHQTDEIVSLIDNLDRLESVSDLCALLGGKSLKQGV